MKKVKLNAKASVCLVLSAAGMMLLGSCAEGYEAPNGFDAGVKNTQIETPEADSLTFKVSTDGKTATISWPTVMGADGAEVTFLNVDDPENPVVVDGYDKKIVDGSKFTVSVTEDSRYQMTMRTLGNHKLGNTDATEEKVYNFSTMIPAVAVIPSGSDIYEFMQNLQLDTVKTERAIELEAHGEYTLSGQVDFGPHNLTLRGNKVHRPTVRILNGGSFATYCGLKVKYINFDMTEASSSSSFLFMSNNNLPDSIKAGNRPGYSGSKLSKNNYMVEEPIYIAHCWFKNLPGSIFHDNSVKCCFWYFTLTDCIVQLNREKGAQAFISFEKAGESIKNITLEKSTIYNIYDCDAYFIRFSNNSQSQPVKAFGDASSLYKSHSLTLSHTTFSKTFTTKNFTNNINPNDYFVSVDHCIFNQVAQCYRMQANGGRTFRFNFWFGGSHPRDLNETDSSGTPFAMEYDPKFLGDITQELDLMQPNGGINFTPGEYEIVANNGGDPRWLPNGGGDDEETEE